MNYPINKGSKFFFFFFPFISVVYNMYDDACVFNIRERERERERGNDDNEEEDDEDEDDDNNRKGN